MIFFLLYRQWNADFIDFEILKDLFHVHLRVSVGAETGQLALQEVAAHLTLKLRVEVPHPQGQEMAHIQGLIRFPISRIGEVFAYFRY